MEQKPFTLGPWGGNGGSKFDDGYSDGIREIILEVHSQLILSITTVYDKQGSPFKEWRHGGANREITSRTEPIKLDYPSEYLIGVYGSYSSLDAGNPPYIRSLKFRTNRDSYGPYGLEEGTPFEFTNETLEIVGFHERSGWYLDSIGIHVRHRKTLITTNQAKQEKETIVKPPKGFLGRCGWYLSPRKTTTSATTKKTETTLLARKEPETKDGSALVKFGKDLTELAKAGKLDPVIGRDDEIRRCIQILSRRTKNNPMLIGEPGVGKTAISEGLARRIVGGDVPQVLLNSKLISLDMGALVAGTKFRGQFEERLKDVLKQVTESDGHILLFIDEIHIIVGAGATSKGAMDASNLLKPMLSRGELQCIGATTLEEYRKHIEKDNALERRFQQVYVEQPTVENTISILRGLRERYELHHGVSISDRALVEAANLSDRYISGRFLPDKAIDLVDEAAAKLKMEMTSKPTTLDEIGRKILRKEMEKLSLVNENDSDSKEKLDLLEKELTFHKKEQDKLTKQWNHEKKAMTNINSLKKLRDDMILQIQVAERQNNLIYAAELNRTVESLKQQVEKLEKGLNEDTNSVVLREKVIEDDVAGIVSHWTGIPVAKLKQSEKESLLDSENELRKRVVGQDHAVKAVARAIQRSRAGLAYPHRPIASFMFMGPTGVGKTELAKTVASYLFNTEGALVRIDMSEYKERVSVSRLIGAPPGYVGHEDHAGQLTETIRRRPYAVILFDEIEKAHPDVLDILLPVLDDGRITDSGGRTVNFTNTVIIMTSNVGSDKILNAKNIDDNDNNASTPMPNQLANYEVMKQRVMDAARSVFKPEFINRVDEFIVFQPLDPGEITKIVELQMKQVEQRIEYNTKIKIQVTDDAIKGLASWGYDPNYGARPVKRVIQQNILDELAPFILKGEFKEEDTILIHREHLMIPKLSFKKLEVGSTSAA